MPSAIVGRQKDHIIVQRTNKMGQTTNISWADFTWNIARGCTKVSDECQFCYMMREGEKYGYNGKKVVRTKTVFDAPLKYKKTKSEVWDGPPLCFTSSLTDFFHAAIDEYREEAWEIIRKCPHITFLILTKRTNRIKECLPADWGNGYTNVWLGASVGRQDPFYHDRLIDLLRIPAAIHFLSLEPLLEHIALDFDEIAIALEPDGMGNKAIAGGIDWVIVGGESGNDTGNYRYRPCHIDWINSIVTQCQRYQVPVFVKQLGTYLAKHLKLTDRHGANMNEWKEYLRIREFPKQITK